MNDAEVYHIVPREDWEVGAGQGRVPAGERRCAGIRALLDTGASLPTANRYFHGEDGLVLLCIDTAMVTSPLRYEPPDMPGHDPDDHELFPHLYGALNLDAVKRVLPFPCHADGSFSLPQELAGSSRANPVFQATQMTEETAQRLLHFIENTEPR